MVFWQTVWSNVLGGIGAGLSFVLTYLIVQWFLQATDLLVSYNWSYKTEGGVFSAWPNFDIRNRSRTRSYRIANIAYTRNGQVHWFDNDSPGDCGFQMQSEEVRIRSVQKCRWNSWADGSRERPASFNSSGPGLTRMGEPGQAFAGERE